MPTLATVLDPAAVITSGGLVDASTVAGQVDEEADYRGAIGALVSAGDSSLDRPSFRRRRPYAHPLSERRRQR